MSTIWTENGKANHKKYSSRLSRSSKYPTHDASNNDAIQNTDPPLIQENFDNATTSAGGTTTGGSLSTTIQTAAETGGSKNDIMAYIEKFKNYVNSINIISYINIYTEKLVDFFLYDPPEEYTVRTLVIYQTQIFLLILMSFYIVYNVFYITFLKEDFAVKLPIPDNVVLFIPDAFTDILGHLLSPVKFVSTIFFFVFRRAENVLDTGIRFLSLFSFLRFLKQVNLKQILFILTLFMCIGISVYLVPQLYLAFIESLKMQPCYFTGIMMGFLLIKCIYDYMSYESVMNLSGEFDSKHFFWSFVRKIPYGRILSIIVLFFWMLINSLITAVPIFVFVISMFVLLFFSCILYHHFNIFRSIREIHFLLEDKQQPPEKNKMFIYKYVFELVLILYFLYSLYLYAVNVNDIKTKSYLITACTICILFLTFLIYVRETSPYMLDFFPTSSTPQTDVVRPPVVEPSPPSVVQPPVVEPPVVEPITELRPAEPTSALPPAFNTAVNTALNTAIPSTLNPNQPTSALHTLPTLHPAVNAAFNAAQPTTKLHDALNAAMPTTKNHFDFDSVVPQNKLPAH